MKKTLLVLAAIVAVALIGAACARGPSPRELALDKDNADLKAAQARLSQENSQVKNENTNLKDAQTRLNTESTQLKNETANLKTTQTRLDTESTQLKNENANLKTTQTRLDTESNQLKRENADLKATQGRLNLENSQLKEIAGPPPASLDNFFPPKAPAPLFLIQMFAMATPFEGIMGDLLQGDIPNVQANYDKFKAEYTKASQMVPEWKERYPMAPVDELGVALKTGDPAKIGPAMGKMGAVCESCHLVNRPNVYAKYHWPDFNSVSVDNTITGQKEAWNSFMFFVAGTFTGIGNDLQQGQLDNARKNFQAFKASFDNLRQACSACHATPRAYFVDTSVQGMIDQIGAELNKAGPNPKTVGDLMGAVGNESCMKCHLVHQPAAFAKERWGKTN